MQYDWIEIGTANFDTLCQKADKKNHIVKGLSIEPLKEHLDDLPNVIGVEKLNIAMSDYCGEIDIWWIPLNTIKEEKLPNWVRGCNSVNHPHPTLLKRLGDKYYKFARVERVPVWNWERLVSEKNISSIEHLKIDTEGHDVIIMKDYISQCNKNPNLWANRITFEFNVLSNGNDVQNMLSLIKEKYNIQYFKNDVILNKNI